MTNHAKTTMLIRAPQNEVFDAFVTPDKITQFWLKTASGPLAQRANVTWVFLVPGATEQVSVTAFHRPDQIAFDWSNGLHVSLGFAEYDPGVTQASVDVTGFDDGSSVEQVVSTTEGFSIVLCDLKTLLESGSSANLVRDKAELIAHHSAKPSGDA
jgi:uncharacterized protein YndB with AHSA1/START domain